MCVCVCGKVQEHLACLYRLTCTPLPAKLWCDITGQKPLEAYIQPCRFLPLKALPAIRGLSLTPLQAYISPMRMPLSGFPFFRENHLQNYTSSTSSHLHLCTITFSPISLLIFTPAHLHLCSSSHPCAYISAHLYLHILASTSPLIFTSAHLHLCSSSHPHIYSSHLHLSLSLTFSLKAGGCAAGPPRNATL